MASVIAVLIQNKKAKQADEENITTETTVQSALERELRVAEQTDQLVQRKAELIDRRKKKEARRKELAHGLNEDRNHRLGSKERIQEELDHIEEELTDDVRYGAFHKGQEKRLEGMLDE